MPLWLFWACGSALFAALTTIFSKVGIRDINSHVATMVRTCVVLVAAWGMVAVTGQAAGVLMISAKSMWYLALSGLATGGSWLCYFRALQLGRVSAVAAVDKTSTILTMLLAFLVLGEPLTASALAAMALMLAGGALMTLQRTPHSPVPDWRWLPYAAGSALLASLQFSAKSESRMWTPIWARPSAPYSYSCARVEW